MSRVIWDDVGEKTFRTGVDRGMLYVPGNDGVPWNGLTSVAEKASGGSATPYYIDGVKYQNVSSPEEYGATISAFTYPDEFAVCDGTAEVDTGLFIRHQPRKPFSFSYRTLLGNDVLGSDYGYVIHLVYNALANPSSRDGKSISATPDAETFGWDISVLPPAVTGFYASGHLEINSTIMHPGALAEIENILYGTDTANPRMPDVPEMLTIIAANASSSVVDNGDGTFTITADPDALVDNGDGTYSFNSNSVVDNGDGTFTISTL